MSVRLLILLVILFAVVSWILKKKQIKITLSPLGKLVVVRLFQQLIRLVMRRLGL
ncbi:MAG: hypothetical protein HQL72_12360 [Magnetococcales bacterium]|nr:hypothetical protein [Magnetococcales bacterium]